MAEVSLSANRRHKTGSRRCKKISTKVDLTPMVDLGFLLITFFILTTSLSEPKMLKLIMPADGPGMPVRSSAALTILPVSNNRIFYYYGSINDAMVFNQYGITGYSADKGIGMIIRQKQQLMDKDPVQHRTDLMVIIKPGLQCNYRNIVDLLDEVLINDVSHYSFTEISEGEKVILAVKNIE